MVSYPIKKILQEIQSGKKLIAFIGVKAFGRGVELFIPLLVAYLFNPEILGSFSLFKMILFFSTTLFIGPLLAPFNINSNKEFAERGKANQTFTSVLIYSASAVAFFLLFYGFFGRELIGFTSLPYEEYKYLFIWSFLGIIAFSFFSSLFLAQNNKRMHSLVEVIYPVSMLVYLTILYYVESITLYNVLAGYAVGGAVVVMSMLWFVNYKLIFPLSFSKKNLYTLIHFVGWVSLGYVASYFINWGDNIILRLYVGLDEIGVYNLAYQFFKAGTMLAFMFAAYFTPDISRHIKNQTFIQDYLSHKRKSIMYVILIGFIVSEIFVGPFITSIFSTEYHGAIPILRILMGANLLMFFNVFYLPLFNATKNYKFDNIILVLQLLSNVIFNLIFIPKYGALGAAIGTLLSYIMYTLILLYIFRKKIKPLILSADPKIGN